MAVFYPPPQPFIGGRQPLAPRVLPPSITAVPVNNPPFSIWQRTVQYLEISRAWDAPPPNPFLGGRQPLAPAQLAPSITAVPVNNPPFGKLFPQVLLARLWIPIPPQPPTAPLLVFTSAPVQFIPGPQNLQPIFQWWVRAVLPTLPAPKQISSVDNPPIVSIGIPPYQWWARPPQPQLPLPSQIVSVDNPPPLVGLVIALRSPSPTQLPYQPNYLVQPFIPAEVVDQPPAYTPSYLQLLWWQLQPALPVQLPLGEAVYELPPAVIPPAQPIILIGGDDAPRRRRKRKSSREQLDELLERVQKEVEHTALQKAAVELVSEGVLKKDELDSEEDDMEVLLALA